MNQDQELLRQAQDAAAWLKENAPGYEAEVYLARGEESGVEFKEGELESIQESRQEGTGLRLIKDGRQGFAYGPGLGLNLVKELCARVRSHLPYLEADESRRLPRAGEFAPSQDDAALRASLMDPEALKVPLLRRMEQLREMEAAALRLDKRVKKALRSGYGESWGEVAIANTEGLASREAGTYCSLGLAVTAEDGAELQIGSASDSRRFSSDLDGARAAKDAVERAAALLNGKKLPTGRRDILLDPWVAGEFLDLITSALSADQVQRGKSLLQGKLGKAVASSRVSFIDDPRLPKGIASSFFDDEGVPTARKTMVERGVLKDYFYDTYTASREKRASNGSAGRASFKGLPRPGNSNFYLEPGTLSREELIKDTQSGVLVFEVLGMHTANPVNGEFSVGLSGIAVENGRLTHGVKGSMLSSSILEILGNVDAAASDLTFYGSLGAPTFRSRGLTVA